MVVYGPPGVGKTEFGAQIPGCVFLVDDKEDGINTLKDFKRGVRQDIPVLPQATNWVETLGMLASLRNDEHSFKGLVLDSLSGFERHCHEHVCRRDYGGDWKTFDAYKAGYDVSVAEWRVLLSAIDQLRDERGMVMCLLAHSKVAPFKNPVGPDFDNYTVDMHAKTWAATEKWADAVLFMNYDVTTAKESGKIKGKGGQRRVLYTTKDAAYTAKSRYGLPDEIEMGNCGADAWTNLTAAIRAAKQQEAN